MLLRRYEAKNYLSIHEAAMDGLGNFNVLIGRNNSGKSAVFSSLYFLSRRIRNVNVDEQIRRLPGHDQNKSLEMRLRFKLRESDRQEFLNLLFPDEGAQRERLFKSQFMRMAQFLLMSLPGNPNTL